MIGLVPCERQENQRTVSAEVLTEIRSSIQDLRNHDGGVRQEARNRLIFIGRMSVPFLTALLQDRDDDVRWEAVKALGEIGDPRSAPELAERLMDGNYGVRWAASEALIGMGEKALIPVLEKLTRNPESSWVRRQAHRVLSSVATKNSGLRDTLRPVITALESFDADVTALGPAYKALDTLKKRVAVC